MSACALTIGRGDWLLPDDAWHGAIKPVRRRRSAVAATAGDRLLAGLIAGDQGAFEDLVNAHYDGVYRVAARIVGNAGEAEDATQEAFLKLWRNPAQVRAGGAVAAWLKRVAANAAIDRLRRLRPASHEALETLADPAAGAEADLARDGARRVVEAAIARLPERQRIALCLTYYEAMSNADTAAVLDVGVEAVESLLARARRNLKSALADNWRELLDTLSE